MFGGYNVLIEGIENKISIFTLAEMIVLKISFLLF